MKLAACALIAACTASGGTLAHSPIPDDATQLVTAIVDDWSSTNATLQLFQRARGSGWQPVGDPWPGVIGAKGAAWGDGLHGRGAPSAQHGPLKHEGDQTSPAGAFAIRGAYGYAATPPTGTILAYTPSRDPLRCVDDPSSAHYAQIVDRDKVATPDWKTAELIKRPDALYTWIVDVAHNPQRIRGDGSCIFLHVWDGPSSTTVGCTAMAEPRLAQLVAVLQPTAVFVLLPRAAYESLAGAWGLPKSSKLPP